VAIDRDTRLRKAEKLLRQGRLDGAIAEYLRVIEDQPRDWNTINIVGDLYVRAGQIDNAVAQYTTIADHFGREGFFSKASALYKKILKIKPGDDHALLQMAEMATQQGLLADAKAALNTLSDQRTRRGDRRGAAEIAVRIASLDPADPTARLNAARAYEELGDRAGAKARYQEAAADLAAAGKTADALNALVAALRVDPDDTEIRSQLIRRYLDAGDLDRARGLAVTAEQLKSIAAELTSRDRVDDALAVLSEVVARDPSDIETRVSVVRTLMSRREFDRAAALLPADVAGDNPDLLLLLAELDLRAGRLDEGRNLLARVLAAAPKKREELVPLGYALSASHADAAFTCLDVATDAAIADNDFASAAAALHEFVTRVQHHIPALMKLVEVCVDGGLEATMYSAQALLTDAYLAAGRWTEARVIAEDLVAREPWERVNIERFRRALEALGEKDPDAIIADRLSGESPFISTDLSLDFDSEIRVDEEAEPGPAPPKAAPPPVPPPAQRPPRGEPAPVGAAAEKARERAPKPAPGAIDLTSILGKEAAAGKPPARESEALEIDLTGALDDMDVVTGKPREEVPDLEQVFKDLREDVSRQTVASAAAEQYKLALTYRDMGMLDEAMRALEQAVRSPRLRFEAASMLAKIYADRGMDHEAVEWFERAAEAPAPTVDAGRALLYDLGQTLEKTGEAARALAVFLELQSDAGEYRDVSARIQRLSKAQTRG